MAIPPVMNIVLFVLMFASWIVMMAGAAAWQDERSSTTEAEERVVWWPVWFEFFLLVLFVACIVTGKMDEWKGVLVAFAAMASAYLMPRCEVWLVASETNGLTDKWEDIFKTNAAGNIMVVIVNWICIILYGNDSFRDMLESKMEAVKEPIEA